MPLFVAQEFDPFAERTALDPLGREHTLSLKLGQVPLWLSFLPRVPGQPACLDPQLPPVARFLGAVLDSGHGHTLSVTPGQLGLPLSDLEPQFDPKRSLKICTADGTEAPVPRLLGDLWIHSNLPPRPHALRTLRVSLGQQGIACYGQGGPRVPILGQHTLALARLNVYLRYHARGRPPRPATAMIFVP